MGVREVNGQHLYLRFTSPAEASGLPTKLPENEITRSLSVENGAL
jgi:hypothetical protein